MHICIVFHVSWRNFSLQRLSGGEVCSCTNPNCSHCRAENLINIKTLVHGHYLFPSGYHHYHSDNIHNGIYSSTTTDIANGHCHCRLCTLDLVSYLSSISGYDHTACCRRPSENDDACTNSRACSSGRGSFRHCNWTHGSYHIFEKAKGT